MQIYIPAQNVFIKSLSVYINKEALMFTSRLH